MRIVHVASWYVPGLDYDENCLPLEQARMGHEVNLLTSDRVPSLLRATSHFRQLYPNGKFESGKLERGPLRIVRHKSLPEVYGQVFLLGLMKSIRELDPDIVHCHGALTPSAAICVFLKPQLCYKLLIDDHSHLHLTKLDNPTKRIYVKGFSWLYRSKDASIAAFLPVTAASQQFLSHRLGVQSGKIIRLGLGVDTAIFKHSDAKRAETRKDLGITEDAKLIVTAGKFRRQKEIRILLEGVARANPGAADVRLMLIGDASPADMALLHSHVANLNLEGKVLFHPFADRNLLSRLFCAADIGVWPGEPSVTVFGALASGLPCILPDDEEAYDLVRLSGAAAFFEAGNSKDLADVLMTVASNPPLARRLVSNAIDLVETKLAWRAVAERTLEVYKEVISSPEAE